MNIVCNPTSTQGSQDGRGSWYKVPGSRVWSGPGPGLLSTAGFIIWAAQCGRGQDGGACVSMPTHLLPAEGGVAPLLSSCQPAQEHEAELVALLVHWFAWLFPIPQGKQRRGRRWRPVHHCAREAGHLLSLCPPCPRG